MPSDVNKAELEYQAWFANLCQSSLGTRNLDVTSGYPQTVKYGVSEVVFFKQGFSISGNATVKQLTEFLYRFYEARILHQITMLSLVPETEGTGANLRLTGRLRFNITFDVVSLANAPPDRDFKNDRREMKRTLEDYQNVVARRNLYGPPNVAPKLETDDDLEFETGEDISVTLNAIDSDQDQELKIELVDKSSPGAELVQSGANTAILTVPALPRGRHRFLARVTDNGWPYKSQDMAAFDQRGRPETGNRE